MNGAGTSLGNIYVSVYISPALDASAGRQKFSEEMHYADDVVKRQIKEAVKVVEMFKSHKTGIIEALIHQL